MVVSDLHCGCQFGLCPPHVVLDGGGEYRQSALQAKIWQHWLYFWHTWVPSVVERRRWVVVINGDLCDGRHHNSTTQVSQNLADQQHIALECLRTAFALARPEALYIVRGTEVHCGQSAENETKLADALKAVPDSNGNRARNELWLRLGSGRVHGLAHFLHHIGTCGSMAYETTALCKEYAESCSEAARWGLRPPDWVVRSHRHRSAEVRVPTANGRGSVIVTPGWQAKTPFAFRIAGARQSHPQFGGVALVAGGDELYTRSYVHAPTREKPEYA